MTRVLKNLRNRLVEDGDLKSGIAPSYYLEGLLYNVPVDKFEKSYEDCFVNAINWIQNEADKAKFACCNEQYYLPRGNSRVCRKPADAEAFLTAAIGFGKRGRRAGRRCGLDLFIFCGIYLYPPTIVRAHAEPLGLLRRGKTMQAQER